MRAVEMGRAVEMRTVDMGLGRQLRAWVGARVSKWVLGRPAGLADHLVGDVDRDLDDMRLITRTDAGPAALLPERLGLLGHDVADVARASPALLARLEATCSACPHWRQCARDLAHGDAGTDGYCCNAELLAALGRRDGRA